MDTYKITEREFEAQVKDLAVRLGYMYYHTWRSFHSPAGFPDCTMVRLEPTPKLIVAELKSATGQLTIEQYAWLRAIQELGKLTGGIIDAYLWKPDDMEPNGGEIVEILR